MLTPDDLRLLGRHYGLLAENYARLADLHRPAPELTQSEALAVMYGGPNTERQPIPLGVYFKRDTPLFVDSGGITMGVSFLDKWWWRRDEFPVYGVKE